MNLKPTEVFSEAAMSVACLFQSISINKVASRVLEFGGQTVLEHVVKRALHYGLAPVVCTTDLQEDDEIDELSTI